MPPSRTAFTSAPAPTNSSTIARFPCCAALWSGVALPSLRTFGFPCAASRTLTTSLRLPATAASSAVFAKRLGDVRAVLQEDLGRVEVPEESGQAEGREAFRVRRVDPRAGLSQDRLQPAGVACRGRLVNPERVFRRALQEEAERSGGPVIDRGEDEGPVRRAHPEDEGIPVEDRPDFFGLVFLHCSQEIVFVGHRFRLWRRARWGRR